MFYIFMIRRFMKELEKDHVSAYAAQAAFFIVLSFIPFFLLLLTLVQYTPVQQADILRTISNVFPLYLVPLVTTIITEIYTKPATITIVTAVTALWSAGKGVMSIIKGLNSVYDIEESRGYVLQRIMSAAYTLVFLLMIIASFVLLVFGNRLQGFLEREFPFMSGLAGVLISLRTVLMLLFLVGFFLLFYKILPDRRAQFRNQLPGAVFTTAGWALFSFGFSVYIDHFNGFSMYVSNTDTVSNVYGTMTTLIILMLWLYFGMYIMLIGGEFNAYYEAYKNYLDIVEERREMMEGEKKEEE